MLTKSYRFHKRLYRNRKGINIIKLNMPNVCKRKQLIRKRSKYGHKFKKKRYRLIIRVQRTRENFAAIILVSGITFLASKISSERAFFSIAIETISHSHV